MKKVIVLLLILGHVTFAGAMEFEAFNGNVQFDHPMHRNLFSCKECHKGPTRHMELDRGSAHELCIGCHKRQKKGPINHCGECHKVT